MAAVASEIAQFVGGRVQEVRQPDDSTVGLALYAAGREAFLTLSCHPEFARAYLATRRPPNAQHPPQFCNALRARVEGGRLVSVRQIDFDRVLELRFEHEIGISRLVCELMGKHSNLILVDSEGKVVGAAKWISRNKSVRPIQSGSKYEKPPFPPRPSLLDAAAGDDLKTCTGASPFLLEWIDANEGGLSRVQKAVRTSTYDPVLSPGFGAYPLPVSALGLPEVQSESVSVALEKHYQKAILAARTEALRGSLIAQLERVALAREVALSDLRQAETAGAGASKWQLMGELILAYGMGTPTGADELAAEDYSGTPIAIRLDPDLDFKANAERYFAKAKRAKNALPTVRDQIVRQANDLEAVKAVIDRALQATLLKEVEALDEEARKRRWLHSQLLPTTVKEDRPYAGHRIRELLGPGGVSVLFGENAESNDYLTLRVAKPNDLWLHVRGGVSAHVVIPTRNAPDEIGREALMFAAKVAVQDSPSKHSGYVPVDYTLRKYVRKPRGAAKGTALYTHEKTVHVES